MKYIQKIITQNDFGIRRALEEIINHILLKRYRVKMCYNFIHDNLTFPINVYDPLESRDAFQCQVRKNQRQLFAVVTSNRAKSDS